MKRTTIACFGVCALLLLGQTAGAIDLPEGGDAIFYQLRGAKSAVLAKLSKVNKDSSLEFTKVADLNGQHPATFQVAVASDLPMPAPKVGETYLLYLDLVKAPSSFALAMSIYSIRPVASTEVKNYQAVFAAYLKGKTDAAAFKKTLLSTVDQKDAYLQYSAVSDLITRRLLTVKELPLLWSKLKAGALVEVQARTLVVQQAGRLGQKTLTPDLEALVKNVKEAASVRIMALSALRQLKAEDSLKKLAPIITTDPSLKLKLRALETKHSVE